MEPETNRGDRQPRASQEEMADRKAKVLDSLSQEEILSIHKIMDTCQLTYSQTIGLLRIMEHDGLIEKVGKDGRNVLYSKKVKTLPSIPFQEIIDELNKGNAILKITGIHMIDGSNPELDLCLPSGEFVKAQLVA